LIQSLNPERISPIPNLQNCCKIRQSTCKIKMIQTLQMTRKVKCQMKCSMKPINLLLNRNPPLEKERKLLIICPSATRSLVNLILKVRISDFLFNLFSPHKPVIFSFRAFLCDRVLTLLDEVCRRSLLIALLRTMPSMDCSLS